MGIREDVSQGLTSWNGLLDFLGSDATVNLESDQILRGSQLELSDIALFVLQDLRVDFD